MPDPKTIKLLVTIPDPGDYCRVHHEDCPLLSIVAAPKCGAGHLPIRVPHTMGAEVLRPRSCKDAEVKV
jgi:hypothetical protein